MLNFSRQSNSRHNLVLPIKIFNNSIFRLWLLFFVFSIILGMVFSHFILPNISFLHTDHPNHGADSNFFNQIAINLYQEIKEFGWSHWSLYPTSNTAGQSSILAIFYYFFGVNSKIFIPISAFFNAVSGILIYLIVLQILERMYAKNFFALISALLFLAFPSYNVWACQINKEAFVNAGFLIILWSFLEIFSYDHSDRCLFKKFILIVFGLFLIGSMRPYLFDLLDFIFVVLIIFQIIRFLPFKLNKLIFTFLCLLIVFFINYEIDQRRSVESKLERYPLLLQSSESETFQSNKNINWQESHFLPYFIDKKIEALASARKYMINYNLRIKANNLIDGDQSPNNVIESINYIPRSLQISIFAPFPKDWIKNNNLAVSTAISIEMFILYISFIGLLFLIYYQYTSSILICLIFTILPLLVFGFVTPNIGTLYRIRYPYEMILLALGISGWNIFLNYQGVLNRANKNAT